MGTGSMPTKRKAGCEILQTLECLVGCTVYLEGAILRVTHLHMCRVSCGEQHVVEVYKCLLTTFESIHWENGGVVVRNSVTRKKS